jgi:hypothetical protein
VEEAYNFQQKGYFMKKLTCTQYIFYGVCYRENARFSAKFLEKS